MKKYILHPGVVKSKFDGDEHYISALKLAELYGVDFNDCYADVPNTGNLLGVDQTNLIDLFPRYNGDYKEYMLHLKK